MITSALILFETGVNSKEVAYGSGWVGWSNGSWVTTDLPKDMENVPSDWVEHSSHKGERHLVLYLSFICETLSYYTHYKLEDVPFTD